MIKLVVHSVILAGFIHTWYLDYLNMPLTSLPIQGQPFSRLGWLTMVTMTLQTMYHILGVFIVLFRCEKSCRFFQFIGQVVIGPLGLAVAILFWGMWTFDPTTLAKDTTAMKLMELWKWNHGMHTLPAISAVLDVLVWRRPNPPFGTAVKTILVVVVLYIADIYVIQSVSGNWPYPILGQLDNTGRIVFYCFAVSILVACYGMLALLNRLVHGSLVYDNSDNKKTE